MPTGDVLDDRLRSLSESLPIADHLDVDAIRRDAAGRVRRRRTMIGAVGAVSVIVVAALAWSHGVSEQAVIADRPVSLPHPETVEPLLDATTPLVGEPLPPVPLVEVVRSDDLRLIAGVDSGNLWLQLRDRDTSGGFAGDPTTFPAIENVGGTFRTGASGERAQLVWGVTRREAVHVAAFSGSANVGSATTTGHPDLANVRFFIIRLDHPAPSEDLIVGVYDSDGRLLIDSQRIRGFPRPTASDADAAQGARDTHAEAVVRAEAEARRARADAAERQVVGVWPETTVEEAQAAIARLDAGADPWRSEQQTVATRFLIDVLGWPDAIVADSEPSEDGTFGAHLSVESPTLGTSASVTVRPLAGSSYWVVGSFIAPTPSPDAADDGASVSIGNGSDAVHYGGWIDGTAAELTVRYGNLVITQTDDDPPAAFTFDLGTVPNTAGMVMVLFRRDDGVAIGGWATSLPPGAFAAG